MCEHEFLSDECVSQVVQQVWSKLNECQRGSLRLMVAMDLKLDDLVEPFRSTVAPLFTEEGGQTISERVVDLLFELHA